MFRFFENLVDPYSPYEDDLDPPAGLMQYLVYHTKPFRTLFMITGIATIFAAVFPIKSNKNCSTRNTAFVLSIGSVILPPWC